VTQFATSFIVVGYASVCVVYWNVG